MPRPYHEHRAVRAALYPAPVALTLSVFVIGAAASPTAITSPAVTPTTSQGTLPTPTGTFRSSWDFVRANEWIAVPVIAAIGWINTWLIAVCRYRGDTGSVADRRYAGLAKRTVSPTLLADDETATPNRVVGCATIDPGLSSQFEDLQDPSCKAGVVGYISWVVQLLAVLYAIVLACIFWTNEARPGAEKDYEEFPQLLAVLNINRGTWALAILGCLVPYYRRRWLIGTTVIAVVVEALFIIRAFLIARHIQILGQSQSTWGVAFAYLFPALEASVFCIGAFAAIFRIKYLSPVVFLFPGMWLVFGPLIIIGLAVLTRYISVNSPN